MHLTQNLISLLALQMLTASAANLPWSQLRSHNNPSPTSTCTKTTLPSFDPLPYCTNPNTGTPSQGGCSSDCYCDSDADGINAYCASSGDVCSAQCSADADCGPESFCSNRPLCGYSFCESSVGCVSSAEKPLRFDWKEVPRV